MEFVQLVVALLIGVALGGVGVWFVLRGRLGAAANAAEGAERDLTMIRAEMTAANANVERARGEAAQARGEAAQAGVRIESARAEVAEAERRVAEAKQEAADARAQAADMHAQLAAKASEIAGARAERDAARQRAAEVLADRELMTTQFKNTSTELLELQGRRADEMAEKRLLATGEALKPMHEALATFQERLKQVERERLEMTKDLQAQVQAVRSTGDGLRQETSALVTALRKPQVRGAWGEMQLRRVVEIAGMVEYCDFDLQVSTSTDEGVLRPDMRVNLAGGKFVYVDAKVPLVAFLEAQEAKDDVTRAEALRRFGKNIKAHVDGLSSKQYWTLDVASPEFVVMFLGTDALLQEGLAQVPDLYEYAASRKVIIATPMVLIATMKAISYGWQQSALAANAAHVLSLGRELYSRLAKMGGDFERLGRQLATTVKTYNTTVGSLESRVLSGARKFQELKVTDAELIELTACEEQPRQLTKAELVASAAEVADTDDQEKPAPSTADESVSQPLPETDELNRSVPEPDELITDADAGTDGDHIEAPIQLEWRRATMGR